MTSPDGAQRGPPAEVAPASDVPPAAEAEATLGAAEGAEAPSPADQPAAHEGFVVRLPDFEGPLDLLLHLIERDDLDVTAVSLLHVTEQYLAHLRSGEAINLAALADFVAMGARLLLLKSRALLPREEQPDEGDFEEESDPEALVAALQEYRRYKRAADHLRGLEEAHRTVYRREAPPPDVPLPTGLDRVTLDSLVELFRDVLERLPPEEELPEVEREPVSLSDRIDRLVTRLEATGRASFRELIEGAATRVEVVIDFLAVLELVKSGYLTAAQTEAFADIELVRAGDAQAPAALELAAEIDADFATG